MSRIATRVVNSCQSTLPATARLAVRVTQIACLLVAACFTTMAAASEDEWQGIARVVAVGDIHGDYENYIDVLTNAGLINKSGNWAAGETHFVQTGDLPDRGPDTDRIIEHMKKLEGQARRAGGRVHALIGNHEMMNLTGDLRYVHPGEYDALTSRRSKSLREAYYKRVVEYLLSQEKPPVIDEAFRQHWELEHPLGFVEHRTHWATQGEFGKWVLEHNAIIKINNVLFLHAGISPAYLGMSIRQINEQIRDELRNPNAQERKISEASDGPLWYRGLALNDDIGESAHVDAILAHYGAEHIVVGHSPGYGTVLPRFNAKVLVIDTGIAEYYGSHLASLLIEDDKLINVQRGTSVTIPTSPEALLPYLKEIAKLEPNVNNLSVMIERLENPSPPVEASAN